MRAAHVLGNEAERQILANSSSAYTQSSFFDSLQGSYTDHRRKMDAGKVLKDHIIIYPIVPVD